MAILNVKNLDDKLYKRLQKRAKANYRSMAQEVAAILSEVLEDPDSLSIMDLKGLGRELWEGIDPAEFVEGERREWD